jgi:hypothetical protein
MRTQIAENFRAEIDAVHAALLAVPADLADTPWREGGWTRKQIVGHLLDSAANNRQRIVRASIDGSFTGPGYAQSAWVDAHGYTELPWKTLLHWWEVEHEILAAAVNHVSEDRLEAICRIGENEPVTLRFVIEDYFRHQRWHLNQLNAPVA